MHSSRGVRGVLVALALLVAPAALAIEVPIASCDAIAFACTSFPHPPYAGPTPEDWEGATPLACSRYSAAHRVGSGFCPCDGTVCSEVLACDLINPGPEPGFVGAQFGRGRISVTRQDTFSGATTSGDGLALDCECPAGAQFATLHSGVCTCLPGRVWNGTQCVAPTQCSGSTYLETCSPPGPIPVKNNGKGDCEEEKKKDECLVGNPIDPGSGIKTQVEPILGGPTLSLMLVYNSHVVGAAFPLRPMPFGQNWTFDYGMRVLTSFASGVVGVTRPRGQVYQFLPPPSGEGYIADADVADRLERLLDGGGAFIGWRYTSANGDLTEQYDTTGKLVSITTRSGRVTSLEYSTTSTPETIAPKPGLLIKVTDHFGRALEFTYDFRSRIVSMTDAAGQPYTFAYDGPSAVVVAGDAPVSNLTAVSFPGGAQRLYHYNEQAHTASTNLPDALTGITDENGNRFATYQYDSQGRAVSSQHAGGALSYSISYGAEASVTDPLGTSRDYAVQTIHGVAKVPSITGAACPDCGPASQTFDDNGNVQTRTDWNGNRTNYTYDLSRNLETSRTEGLTSTGGATAATRTIDTEWHPTFQLPTRITERDSAGAVVRETAMSHDAAGNVLSRTITAGASSRSWGYTYNANGSVLSMNGPRTDVSDITTYTYYANDDPDLGKRGNLHTVTNALGHVTEITAYNAHGQPLTVVDPNGLTTTLSYDARLRLTSRDVGGELTSYEYDGVGNLTKVTLPDGSFLSYTYDPAHRLTVITDALGNRISYTLDAMGNRTQEQVLDPLGALAQTQSRVFNSLNRLFQEIGAQSQTTQYAYDNQGNVTSIDGPLTGTTDVTANAYDALNRLIRVTDPASGQVSYGYNGLDQLTSVTDPRNLQTTYEVNGLGDLNRQVSPDTGTTTNTYDSAGNLERSTDAKDQVTTYAYDALNRVTSVTFHDGSKQTYTYDQGVNGIGRLFRIADTDPQAALVAQIDYAYDQKGRVISEERAVDSWATLHKVTYQYDAFGRLVTITYPFGDGITSSGTANYSYDAQGRISQVSTTFFDWTVNAMVTRVVVQNVEYHPFGGVKGFAFGNGQTYTRQIDQDGRIASYMLGSQQFNVGYDPASRISFIAENANPSNVNDYGYDALDRLTQAILPNSTYGYGYDATGNRLSKTAGANSETYAYPGTSNRLASITPSSGPVRTYVHDPVGSVTDDGTLENVYDARGRLVQSTHVGACLVSKFRLNALGQRMRKTITTCDTGAPVNDTIYAYDQNGRVLSENHEAGTYKRAYFYLYDIPVGMYLNESN